MDYNLIITERANELLSQLVNHLLYKFHNEQAARHLLDEVESIYVRLQENPYQFPDSHDDFLRNRGYKEAVLPEMNYVIFFLVDNNTVCVHGIFHQLENYNNKL